VREQAHPEQEKQTPFEALRGLQHACYHFNSNTKKWQELVKILNESKMNNLPEKLVTLLNDWDDLLPMNEQIMEAVAEEDVSDQE
jgi:hypothetical protein